MAKVKANAPTSEEDEYQSSADADCLSRAAEIQGDPERHAKAKMHLDKKAQAAADAASTAEMTANKHAEEGTDTDTPQSTKKASGKINLRQKVKAGLKKAFPKDD